MRDPIYFGDQKSIYFDIRRHWQIDRRGPLTQMFKYENKYEYKYKYSSQCGLVNMNGKAD